MVDYQPSDVIAMTEFPLAWRITDDRWARLPETVLARIKPLSLAKSQQVVERSPFESFLTNQPDLEDFLVAREVSLEGDDPPGGGSIRRWFHGLPIDPSSEVYLCWSTLGGTTAVTDWGTFIEFWDDFWYPFDYLFLFDETHAWLVTLGVEERAAFLQPRLSQSSPTRAVTPASVHR